MKASIPKYHSRYFHLFYTLKAFENIKGKILDVGCGQAWADVEIKKERPYLDIVACDKNNKILLEYRKKLSRDIKFLYCDAHKLSFKNDQFDAVLILDLLEHLERPGRAIFEMSRVIKKGGIFHLAVPCEASLFTVDGWIKKFLNVNLKKEPIGHIKQFTVKDIKILLKKNGFKVQKIRYSYHFLYQLFSFCYFLYVAVFNEGKYLPILSNPKKNLLNRIRFFIQIILGYMVFLESSLFAKIKGQTAHITSERL